MSLKMGRIVRLRWFDAWRDSDKYVYELNEIDKVRTELEDVGFYLMEKEGYVVIAEEKGDDGYYRHLHYIPRVNIIEVEVLKK